MTLVRLDRDGQAPVPAGYTVVDNEVQFLKLATEGGLLQVRGEKLCNWAEAYFSGRGVTVEWTTSYVRELRGVLPALTVEQATELIGRLGSKLEALERPLTVKAIIHALAPLALWHTPPSIRHLAEWLVWLYQTQPSEAYRRLLEPYSEQWQSESSYFDTRLYGIQSGPEARTALENWLGLRKREEVRISEVFPLEVPAEFQDQGRTHWRSRVIESQGGAIEQLTQQAIPERMKIIAAEEAGRYFSQKANGGQLNAQRLEVLTRYLSGKELAKLRELLPREAPSNLPDEPSQVMDWFSHEYLPYREWQHTHDPAQTSATAIRAAGQFEAWYLENYPKALNGSKLKHWLSFNKMNQIDCPEGCITLVIVLDGMHIPDSRILLQIIRAKIPRLTITAEEMAFAPIPTVTQFAKEALFRGVPPRWMSQREPVGKVFPDKQSPAERLQSEQTGKVYLWRVAGPDHTYHQENTSETLLFQIKGGLEAEALKIEEIVEKVPDSAALQIILTTDHGRLLSRAQRTRPIPANMESHGRTAWGTSGHSFAETTYVVEDEVAYLAAEAYGMTADLAIPLDESAFKSSGNRGGSEVYPHGGIFPEEVIIPWIVLARDLETPRVKITIHGKGTARRAGKLEVALQNESELDLILESVELKPRKETPIQLETRQKIPAIGSRSIPFDYAPWPSAVQASSMVGSVRLRLPNGMAVELPAEVAIHSDDFQSRPDEDILEDLEL